MISKKIRNYKTDIELNESVEGESIEVKVQRIVENNEPISDGAPIIFTDRRDGVLPAYDIRTDRFDLAIGGMDYVAKSNLARRADYFAQMEQEKGDGTAEPIQATNNNEVEF